MTANLGDRMKRYEQSTGFNLLPRTPVIVRVDGQAFHTYTKLIRRAEAAAHKQATGEDLPSAPYSAMFAAIMVETATYMANNIQNAVCAYVQSDEISLLLRDWDTIDTDRWFGYRTDKVVSSSASIATAVFNAEVHTRLPGLVSKLATFDGRAFNLPREEVTNYFIFRQQDTRRNCVQHIGRYVLGNKAIHGLSNVEVENLLALSGQPLESFPHTYLRGVLVLPRNDATKAAPEFHKCREMIDQLVFLPE